MNDHGMYCIQLLLNNFQLLLSQAYWIGTLRLILFIIIIII